MPPARDDARLVPDIANRLLSDLHVYRCGTCRLVLLQAEPLFRLRRHPRCGGSWLLVDQPLTRTVLLRFLTREMLG